MDASASSRVQPITTTVAVVLTLVLAAVGGCQNQQGPSVPSVEDKREESHIHGQQSLRIGVTTDVPLMGLLEGGVYSGFDIEIARYIATSLGYAEDKEQIEFVSLDTEDRIPALQAGRVDLVVANFSITEEREKQVAFAGPYLVTTQEVLIPTRMAEKIRTIEDLQNPAYRICASGGSTSEAELDKRKVKVLAVKAVADCVAGMLAGRYDATSSDETILAGFRAEHPGKFEIVDMPFGTSELLGIGVSITDPALRDLVSYFLDKSHQAGRKNGNSPWLTAYNRTLGPWLLPADEQQPPPQNVPQLVDFDDRAPRQ